MIIPKTFQIFGQTIKIIFKRNLIDKQQAFGIWDYNKNTIYLQSSTRKHILTKEQIESTVIHEVIHACLEHIGETKLSENESFVTGFSNILHQFLKQ